MLVDVVVTLSVTPGLVVVVHQTIFTFKRWGDRVRIFLVLRLSGGSPRLCVVTDIVEVAEKDEIQEKVPMGSIVRKMTIVKGTSKSKVVRMENLPNGVVSTSTTKVGRREGVYWEERGRDIKCPGPYEGHRGRGSRGKTEVEPGDKKEVDIHT